MNFCNHRRGKFDLYMHEHLSVETAPDEAFVFRKAGVGEDIY